MCFHGVFLGNQHEIWSKQHNGKVRVFNDYEVSHDFERIGRRTILLNARRLDSVQFVLLAMEDITARQHAEDALRRQHQLLDVTLTSIGDAVLTTDAQGRITFLNPVAAALTGWS